MENGIKGRIELYCEICDYAPDEQEITLYSDKVLHVGCARCQKEVLNVLYTLIKKPNGDLEITQQAVGITIHGAHAVLKPGDTYTTEYNISFPLIAHVRIDIPNT